MTATDVTYTILPPGLKPEGELTEGFLEAARNCVFKNWSDSFARSPWRGYMNQRDYAAVMKPIIEASISAVTKRGVLVLAHHPDKSLKEFYGWAACEPDINCLHYGYTTKWYRNKGFFRGCVEKAGMSLEELTYSWRSEKASKMARKWRWRFNPDLARGLQKWA